MNGRARQRNFNKLGGVIYQYLRWLIPGLGVKRWLVVILMGATLIGVGVASLILDTYQTAPDTYLLSLLSSAPFRFLPRILWVIFFSSIGIIFIIGGIIGFHRSLMAPFMRPGRRVVDAITHHRRLERGPRIVVMGGGHGLSILLRGLKEYTRNLTAIVTVSDDGGSSGRLRKSIGILPPGDIRNCLAALSNDEALLTQLFQYRFPNGASGLDGHSFGNLFITALADITGSFEEAVAESGRVLSVSGQVLPATLHDVRLVADVMLPHLVSEVRVEGESSIPESTGKVRRVWLEPSSPPAFPQAVQAILAADLLVIGPGSLYTSIIPNLLVPDIAAAVRASRALKIYVCNLATQPGETEDYNCSDHVHALDEHVGGVFDLVVCNHQFLGKLPEGIKWVMVDSEFGVDYPVYQANLIDEAHPWRHDADKLAQALMNLLFERTGPLVE